MFRLAFLRAFSIFVCRALKCCCRNARQVVAGLLQFRVILDLFPPHLVHGFAQQLHDVEPVEGEFGVREVLPQALDEGRRHVHAGLRDLRRVAAVGHQVRFECLQGLLVPAFHPEQELLRLHVHHQGDVLLAPLGPGLVDPNPGYLRHVHPGPGILHVVMDQPPDSGVVLPNLPGRAQGTCTCFTPSLSHLQRGTRAVR